MYPNFKGSQEVALVGTIAPQSATTAKTSTWVDISQFGKLLAILNVGAITATGKVDAKLQQATAVDGTGAKDITGKAITQLDDTKSNTQYEIDVRTTDLDFNNSFKFVALVATPSTAAAILSATLLGMDPRFGVGSDSNAATVGQVV